MDEGAHDAGDERIAFAGSPTWTSVRTCLGPLASAQALALTRRSFAASVSTSGTARVSTASGAPGLARKAREAANLAEGSADAEIT